VKKLYFFIAACFINSFVFSQNPEKPKLLTGPVVGAVTKNSARVWIAYKGNGQNMLSLIDTVDKTTYHPSAYYKIYDRKGDVALNMDFSGLVPGHVYKPVFAEAMGIVPHPKCTFTTQADTSVKDMSFLVGSCALLNTDISRFVFPGTATVIFDAMKKQRSEFMVWLGDNIYYFHKHYTSYDGMYTRNLKIRRSFPQLREFLAAQPNYAIWDDHDYGWNDADRKFPFKDSSLIVFNGFWPNPIPQANNNDSLSLGGATTFTFRYYDAEFFMTDDRWFRDPEGDTAAAFLGQHQLHWLENKLAASNATFKFVCIGSQVLNDSYFGESYAKYPKERNEMLDFIALNNIRGVIFLTGDKHYAELSKREWKGYTFYDFTSSPLTSPVTASTFYSNTYNVKGTSLSKRNFGKVTITGPAGNRVCKLELFGRGGGKKWEYLINSNELERKPVPAQQK
jgi:alkaline phosphatase D